MSKKAYGFTIMELLIVIIVIGILATISFITYRGIQERAKTVALTAGIDQWHKAILLADMQGIRLSGSANTCLGVAGDFPAGDGFAEGVCFMSADSATQVSYDEAAFAGWGEDRPSGKMPITTTDIEGVTYKARGLWTFNPRDSEGMSILWIPQVSEECGKGEVYASTGPSSLTGGMCVLSVEY